MFKEDEVIEYDGELAADTLVEFLLDVRAPAPGGTQACGTPLSTASPTNIPGGNPGVWAPNPSFA